MWMKLLTMQSEKELLRLISKVEKTLFVFSKWKQTYNLIIIVRFCHRWSQSYFYSRCVVLLLIYIESSIYSEPTNVKFFGVLAIKYEDYLKWCFHLFVISYSNLNVLLHSYLCSCKPKTELVLLQTMKQVCRKWYAS